MAFSCVCFTKGVVASKKIEREQREYDKVGTAAVPYISIEREGEIYRMEYDAMAPLVTNDIDKIQVYFNSIKYKFDAASAANNWTKKLY